MKLLMLFHGRYFLWLATLLTAALPGAAFALGFAEAIALAAREAPQLSAARSNLDAARQAAIPAGELPDPKLILGVDNLPIENSDRFSLNRDFMTMQRIGLMQEFPNRGRRDARIQAAAARSDLVAADLRVIRQSIARETALAWITRQSAERQLAHLGALSEENGRFEIAVRAQLLAGSGPVTDAVMPRQEAALIAARRDELEARRKTAQAQLRRWLGASADEALVGEVPAWPIDRETLLHRLHQHPELPVFEPRARLLDAEIAEAQASKRPGWAVELAYQRRAEEFGDMMMAQVSIDLPIFPASRQQPAIAAKQAERAALNGERDALLREHAAMLEADLAEHQRLQQAENRLNQLLLPLADEKVALAVAQWRGGKGALSTLVAARRERIDSQLEAIAVSGMRQQMAARLHYAYGDPDDAGNGETP